MTFDSFDKFQRELFDEIMAMRDSKGAEYANDSDRFANFKRLAVKNGVSPLVVANIFMTKHLDSIDHYIKTGREGSEPIRGRFIDAILYLMLMAGIQHEEQILRESQT